MQKFSWYTIVHPDWQEGQPPLFRLVGPAIAPDERTCDIYFKENRKGGHTHNHVYNTLYRSTFHHGPRSVGANKPFYRQTLLRGIATFGYVVSNGKLITKQKSR